MCSLTEVLDIRGGRNLIQKRHLPPQWKSKLIPRLVPNNTDASLKPMNIIGIRSLLVRVGDIRAQVPFLVSTLYEYQIWSEYGRNVDEHLVFRSKICENVKFVKM
eukprot:gb/GEZJ01004830.1/.p1 GENE.gb/GEZJ01004830.1/~~gb/GEZJ01004830.1/.p1  ORF type:complete len:105 (-),score=2.38 gb/GEZJ01004830.1/:626-940(-)